MPTSTPRNGGVPLALGAFLMWGVLPIYLRQVHDVPALEFVGWRVAFSLPLCLVLLVALRQTGQFMAALRDRRVLAYLAGSAVLIGCNWTVYVVIVQQGHIFAASLGYYINPLMNVLVGTLFLGERLNRAQWLAVGIAALGVVVLAAEALATVGWSLLLATSFAIYGLLRKKAPVAALPGLTVETLVLALPGAVLIALFHAPDGIALGRDTGHDLLIAASGVITAVPLMLFAMAAQRMNYSILGFLQFIVPTMVFLQGLLLFHEPLMPVQLASFVLIWIALGVFSWDLWARSKA